VPLNSSTAEAFRTKASDSTLRLDDNVACLPEKQAFFLAALSLKRVVEHSVVDPKVAKHAKTGLEGMLTQPKKFVGHPRQLHSGDEAA
jgi:hypothetical protein